MALAQIIDLEERRRARRAPEHAFVTDTAAAPMWCYVWVPMYFWYVA